MEAILFGEHLEQTNVLGKTKHRVYLDSAATSLPIICVQEKLNQMLSYYSSTHSKGHFSATVTMDALTWSKEKILSFVNAPKNIYDVVFIGAGATAAINRLTMGLSEMFSSDAVSLISLMEHHSNDLPHRHHFRNFLHIRVDEESGWCIDPSRLEQLLKNNSKIRYLAVTAASNVTGLINPINTITKIAHKYGVLVLVDGAQIYAHHQISLMDEFHDGVDFFVFSGHKSYAPGSTGVIVAKKKLLDKMPVQYLGGGMVDDVSLYDYKISSSLFNREHAGTPNLLGAISIGLATDYIDEVGIKFIHKKELNLYHHFINKTKHITKIIRYTKPKSYDVNTVGIISFNIENVPHALVGAILNDYFCIAVRTGCFCAHPYVRELVIDYLSEFDEEHYKMHQGMVRASFGMQSTIEDIDKLVEALEYIIDNINILEKLYSYENGVFSHKKKNTSNLFSELILKKKFDEAAIV